MRNVRVLRGGAFVLLVLTAGGVCAAAEKAPTPAAELRAAWLAYAAPRQDAKGGSSLLAQQRASVAAVTHLETAVAGDPKNVAALASLCYIGSGAVMYDKAKAAIDKALALERRDPLLYLLRGQAEAGLAALDPVTAGKNIGKAMDAFDRAAALDPRNALPMLQAVSVALDVDRLDLAQPRLEKALARPNSRLYRLPVPADLLASKADSLRLWEQLQMGLWNSLLTRCQNVSARSIRLAKEAEKQGEWDKADGYYRQALHLARQVGRSEPHLLFTVGTALDMLDTSYEGLWRVATVKAKEAEQKAAAAKARGEDTAALDAEMKRWQGEAAQWEGELGVLEIGRGELRSVVEKYFTEIAANPPATVDDMLALESKEVERAYLGIGLGQDGPGAPAKQPAPKPAAPPAR